MPFNFAKELICRSNPSISPLLLKSLERLLANSQHSLYAPPLSLFNSFLFIHSKFRCPESHDSRDQHRFWWVSEVSTKSCHSLSVCVRFIYNSNQPCYLLFEPQDGTIVFSNGLLAWVLALGVSRSRKWAAEAMGPRFPSDTSPDCLGLIEGKQLGTMPEMPLCPISLCCGIIKLCVPKWDLTNKEGKNTRVALSCKLQPLKYGVCHFLALQTERKHYIHHTGS